MTDSVLPCLASPSASELFVRFQKKREGSTAQLYTSLKNTTLRPAGLAFTISSSYGAYEYYTSLHGYLERDSPDFRNAAVENSSAVHRCGATLPRQFGQISRRRSHLSRQAEWK
mmetsp:Transcript_64247/g.139793  ORF Transcript_64247/g.139793 Transcript_64247/m.139793 type:complete len:114 (+) Transcript_64247:114-455(+)